MAQTSGPKTNQTFTDAEWRRGVGPEPYIQGDLNGTAYSISLAINSDVASIGSVTQDSDAVVGGFPHNIPAGQPEGITVPAATTAARTDLIVLRYDPTWGATDPGPVRLFRIAGTEGSGAPTYDAAPPGVEDFPLWEVTRQPGQALSQATTRWVGLRGGPHLYGSDLPASAPLGTVVRVNADVQATRLLDAQQSATWVYTDVSKTAVARFTLAATGGIAGNAQMWGMTATAATGNDDGVATVTGGNITVARAGVYAVYAKAYLGAPATARSFVEYDFGPDVIRGNAPVGEDNTGVAAWEGRLPAGAQIPVRLIQSTGGQRASTGVVSVVRKSVT